MMNEFSTSPKISTGILAQAFARTTTSYKYFWFLSLLDLWVKQGEDCFMAQDVFVRMVAKAWAPLRYFHLSLGKMDSFRFLMEEILRHKRLRDDSSEDEVVKALTGSSEVAQVLKRLDQYVPFRFLNPWLRTSDNATVGTLSQNFTNDCPYALTKLGKEWAVQLNPLWGPYLRDNYAILRDFAQWHLVRYVQMQNPLVPFVAEKLSRAERPSLSADRRQFWQNYLHVRAGTKCIFTGEPLGECHELLHFLPWSLLPQELNWNLLPVGETVVRQQNNRVTDFGKHFANFCREQHEALLVNAHLGMTDAPVMQQYASLGCEVEELCRMPEREFAQVMAQTFQPLARLARDMGYAVWSA